jgi:hypothetical protein
MGTKKHLNNLKKMNALDEATKDIQKDIPKEETMETMRLKIEEQKNTIEDLLGQIEKLKTKQVNGSFNTTNNNVQNIHMLLHPDMHLVQLTKYDYNIILKKIQDRDFEKVESLESMQAGEDE